jgi:hypothetical protein
MNTYNFKWLVKVPAGQFMAGVHRFKTKKEAQEFVNKWNRTRVPGSLMYYSDLPKVEREGSR